MTPSAGQNSFGLENVESVPGGSGFARPLFTEAEQKIIEQCEEVAVKAAEIERAEHQIKLQQQATAQSWERTQQREHTSKAMLQQSQSVQGELQDAKATVAEKI